MGEFTPEVSEPPRKESPGEYQQRIADLVSIAVQWYTKLELYPQEKAAIAVLVGTFRRFMESAKVG
jgi:hypothetical protein